MFWKALKSPTEGIERRRYTILGGVQGVGFRPFVHRLAIERGLSGWVRNGPAGVVVEAEGNSRSLAFFQASLERDKPSRATIERIDSTPLPPLGTSGFLIAPSDREGDFEVSIPLDLAVCDDCLRELNDPRNRRHRYAFINCAQCGPRYSIITALPYDRSRTTMAGFPMCAACLAEYENPADRRYHAQAVACADCGPHIEFWNADGTVVSNRGEAVDLAAAAVREGKIIALKGLGGFHLVANASNKEAVLLLRARKHRKTKPFALMYPSLESARADCLMSPAEERLLRSAAAPIVLLRQRNQNGIAPSVAPRNPWLGVMLPHTPLHALLMQSVGGPIVATSGNRTGEPVCINEKEALGQLAGVADAFLVHNRPIQNRADDSVSRVAAGREMILRAGRGCAPAELRVDMPAEQTILALGGQLKATVALARGGRLTLSPHTGDLDSPAACAAHVQAATTLKELRHAAPAVVAHDAHPDYRSTRMARDHSGTTLAVGHHYAHALACMADNKIDAPVLAVVFDGAGFGDDGSIWGGEFLTVTATGYFRSAHFLPFPLPGGEKAMRQPRRAALGMLHTMGLGPPLRLGLAPSEARLLLEAMDKNINCPQTTSVGRLFDGVAALCGLGKENSFEGEAAMALEFAATENNEGYEFSLDGGVIDWRPMLRQILAELDLETPVERISARFHNTLARIIADVAGRQARKRVLLTGGCFQNKLLLESTIQVLQAGGFEPFWHRRIPTNDGGLAAGQILAASRSLRATVKN